MTTLKQITSRIETASGSSIIDLIQDEKDCHQDVLDILVDLSKFKNLSGCFSTQTRGIRGQDIRAFTFDIGMCKPGFDYKAWFAKYLCPVGKRLRKGECVVSVAEQQLKGKAYIYVEIGYYYIMGAN